MIISEIIQEIEVELLVISREKGVLNKSRARILKALDDYLQAKNIDLKDYIDITEYRKFLEVTKPKDKIETNQLELN